MELTPGRLAIGNNGGVTSLVSSGGTHLLHPRHGRLIDGKLLSRGGCEAMVPLVGEQPTENYYRSCTMKRHGLFRNSKVEILPGTETEFFPATAPIYRFAHQANDVFPWSFEADLRSYCSETTDEYGNAHMVWMYQISIRRTGNEYTPMPTMVGGHPYLATHGHTAEVHNKGEQLAKIGPDLKDDPVIEKVVELEADRLMPIEIRFSYGTVKLFLLEGFDSITCWTDHTDYFCVEPHHGLVKQMTLLKGDSWVGTFKMEFPIG